MIFDESQQFRTRRPLGGAAVMLQRLHIDGPLMVGLLAVSALGLIVLYSAASGDINLINRQVVRMGVAFAAMFVMAQIPPHYLRLWAPALFVVGLAALALVIFFGDVGKGARRWLDLGFMRFQPSEIMKLAVPMMVAWYLHTRPLPPSPGALVLLALMIFMPAFMIAVQPDLGTALLIASSGILAVLLAGLSVRLIVAFGALAAGAAPVLWYFMHDYQKQRVLTFLDPERDPLGAGYHSIQAKIAIGSGGLFGKGWMNGSQAQLEFLPERSTDFIFAVMAEEFGLLGLIVLLVVYAYVVGRGLYIATQGQDTFSRLLAGSVSLTFFVYVFVNIGMVIGIMPVVGVPLPLVSYGGTSMVTIMAGFGILMSIQTHRKLLAQ
ncbi:MAG: rod shape-determining protein RodA [Pseudomonadota bacterium]